MGDLITGFLCSADAQQQGEPHTFVFHMAPSRQGYLVSSIGTILALKHCRCKRIVEQREMDFPGRNDRVANGELCVTANKENENGFHIRQDFRQDE